MTRWVRSNAMRCPVVRNRGNEMTGACSGLHVIPALAQDGENVIFRRPDITKKCPKIVFAGIYSGKGIRKTKRIPAEFTLLFFPDIQNPFRFFVISLDYDRVGNPVEDPEF